MLSDFVLKTITTPILINLLENEFVFPQLFMLRCMVPLGQFKKRIDK